MVTTSDKVSGGLDEVHLHRASLDRVQAGQPIFLCPLARFVFHDLRHPLTTALAGSELLGTSVWSSRSGKLFVGKIAGVVAE